MKEMMTSPNLSTRPVPERSARPTAPSPLNTMFPFHPSYTRMGSLGPLCFHPLSVIPTYLTSQPPEDEEKTSKDANRAVSSLQQNLFDLASSHHSPLDTKCI